MKRNNPDQIPDYGFQSNPNDVPTILSSNDWRTPDWLFNKVRDEFNLAVDRAADNQNHKLEFFYTKDDLHNVLDINWTLPGYINPPYSNPGVWLRKARKEVIERGVTSVLLVRVDPANNYWIETTIDAHVRYLAGRIKFWDDENKPHYGATFSSALIIFSKDTIGNHNSSYWNYRGEKAERLF